MSYRSEKRALVWEEMKKLERVGLGRVEVVSELRDKFVLNVEHAQASQLSLRPSAQGFIRADEDSLLFRNASESLKRMMEKDLVSLAVNYERGIEFGWGAVDEPTLLRMFDAVAQLAK